MSKGIRNTIIVIIIILLVFAILFAVYTHNKTQPMDANAVEDNILPDPNSGLENMLNDILDETTDDEEPENTEKAKNEVTQSDIDNDNVMTPKETKAINLVKEQWKKKWGSLDDVSFNVSVQSDGKYGVTVYDTTTTQTIKFYVVDVDTEIVKEM